MPIEPRTPEGRDGLNQILAAPEHALIAFDYDGTLSPIVDDPSRARPEPGIVEGLAALARRVGQVAIVTGRPAKIAVDLAGLDTTAGLEDLIVIGHYGMERWDARSGELRTTACSPGVETARRELPGVLKSLDLEAAEIEDKGLSIAVHVRRMDTASDAFARMQTPLTHFAESVGLVAELGRLVIELRPPGMDKGRALRSLAQETDARSVMFVGDDLGDLAAFAEVRRLRSEGIPGLLVCSGSAEVAELANAADLIVDGPAGVSAIVADLTGALPAPAISGESRP